IGDEGETRGRKCSRPEIRTAIRVLTEENELVADFHESEILGVVTSVALAGLVRSQLSRHHIGPAVPAIYEGPDLITRSDAVEISVGRRDAEGTKALNRRSVVQPRQPDGFGGIPPRIDAIGVRGRGRDCLSGPVGSPVVVGLLPLAGRPDDGHQQSDREPAHLGLRPTRRPLVTPLRRAERGSGVRSRGRRAGHGYTRYTPWRGERRSRLTCGGWSGGGVSARPTIPVASPSSCSTCSAGSRSGASTSLVPSSRRS